MPCLRNCIRRYTVRIGYGTRTFLVSAALVLLFVLLLMRNTDENNGAGTSDRRLTLFCAAGIKGPVVDTVEKYRAEYGIEIVVQYAGSGTLLSNIKIVKSGDLYLAADDSYIKMGQDEGLIAESIPLATITPIIAVKKGNPKGITNIEDLLESNVSFALANPDAAAIGKITRLALEAAGMWEKVSQKARVFKPTVGDIATDIVIGSVDAGIIWDATANQYPELKSVSVEVLNNYRRTIEIGVLSCSKNPSGALRFSRYLGAPEKGLKFFTKHHFGIIDGDTWAETPELVLFSGGVNRLALRDTLRTFERREGIRITSVYNGCGILTSQIKAGQHPDAYFACDRSFMNLVEDRFIDVTDVSRTAMVMLLPRGNPKKINKVADLQRPGLAIGVANADQSALGLLTKKVLSKAGIYENIMKNVKTQTPTADLLVNQIRTGSLDAVIVYEANTMNVRNQLEIIRLNLADAEAFQPIAIGKDSMFKHLSRRLMETILSDKSREIFKASGFDWQADGK